MSIQIVGTADDCIQQLGELRRLTGTDHVVCDFSYGRMPADRAELNMRHFAELVLPVMQRDSAFVGPVVLPSGRISRRTTFSYRPKNSHSEPAEVVTEPHGPQRRYRRDFWGSWSRDSHFLDASTPLSLLDVAARSCGRQVGAAGDVLEWKMMRPHRLRASGRCWKSISITMPSSSINSGTSTRQPWFACGEAVPTRLDTNSPGSSLQPS